MCDFNNNLYHNYNCEEKNENMQSKKYAVLKKQILS